MNFSKEQTNLPQKHIESIAQDRIIRKANSSLLWNLNSVGRPLCAKCGHLCFHVVWILRGGRNSRSRNPASRCTKRSHITSRKAIIIQICRMLEPVLIFRQKNSESISLKIKNRLHLLSVAWYSSGKNNGQHWIPVVKRWAEDPSSHFAFGTLWPWNRQRYGLFKCYTKII